MAGRALRQGERERRPGSGGGDACGTSPPRKEERGRTLGRPFQWGRAAAKSAEHGWHHGSRALSSRGISQRGNDRGRERLFIWMARRVVAPHSRGRRAPQPRSSRPTAESSRPTAESSRPTKKRGEQVNRGDKTRSEADAPEGPQAPRSGARSRRGLYPEMS